MDALCCEICGKEFTLEETVINGFCNDCLDFENIIDLEIEEDICSK